MFEASKVQKFHETGKLTYVRTDRNGTQYFEKKVRCWRCDGYGIYFMGVHNGNLIPSSVADGVCFRCGGRGWEVETVKEYTPEYAAKLEARRAKKAAAEAAKREEERAEREAEQIRREAEEAKREAERLAEIERNRGKFIGNVGDKFQAEVTLSGTFSYERSCFNAPWKTETVTGYVFKTDDGNTLVWKTTGDLCRKEYREDGHLCDNKGRYEPVSPDEGDRITIKGTIKDHQEYYNVNQTILNRVTWVK